MLYRKTSHQLRKETKAKLKKVGKVSRKFVHLICKRCKREYKIRINRADIDLYTDELKKNYICLICGVETWYERLKRKGLL